MIMAKEKPILNVAFIGHVDAGKSTTVGSVITSYSIHYTKLYETLPHFGTGPPFRGMGAAQPPNR